MRSLKRVVGAALAASAMLLTACTGIVDPGLPDDTGDDGAPTLGIHVINEASRDGPWTVAVDASAFAADTYHLDAGDGRPVATNSSGIWSIQYPQRGAYVVRVQLGGEAGGMAVPMGCPDCPPPPGAPPDDEGIVRTLWGVVDLSGASCEAIIVALRNNAPTRSFWSWDQPTFWAGCDADSGEDVWYQWKAERRYRPVEWVSGEGWVQQPWTPWHVPAGFHDRHYHQGASWSPYPFFMVPGSGKTGSPVSSMEYRITLITTDEHGCRSEKSVVLTVYTGCD